MSSAGLWKNDKVQFARLLSEIVATQDTLDYDELCASMDCSRAEVDDILKRASEHYAEECLKLARKRR